jgi:hypothetical protein
MPAKKKNKGAKSEGQRKHKVLRDKCSPEEMEFCAAIAKGMSPGKAGVKIFHYAQPDSGYQVLKRPRVQKFLERLLERGEEKFIEKQAEKLALNLDLADSRLTELLSSPRMDESRDGGISPAGAYQGGGGPDPGIGHPDLSRLPRRRQPRRLTRQPLLQAQRQRLRPILRHQTPLQSLCRSMTSSW